MSAKSLEDLEMKMAAQWQRILTTPLAKEIESVLASGDRKLYAMWLCQVSHLTKHTSAHQALIGTRINEINHQYQKFCFEHAYEEVGHEMMAVNDLKKLGTNVTNFEDLPAPLTSTTKLNAYLYFVSERCHPFTRLGFSYWAEKCYPFIATLAGNTKKALGLQDKQMTFFVNHSEIDEKHAKDIERIVSTLCQTPADWAAVESGMVESLNLAIGIFEEIHQVVSKNELTEEYEKFLASVGK